MDRAGECMSWDNLVFAVDFLSRSRVDGISLMGGEPSLHPEFVEFVDYSLQRLKHVTVFTSGVLPASLVRTLGNIVALPANRGRFTIVCNVNSPDITLPAQWQKTQFFLETLGQVVVQSFNIYRTDFDLGFLFSNIARYNLSRQIRLGLAHPIHGQKTECLKPDRFGDVIERVSSFLPQFKAMKTIPVFDCGFPMCAFSDAVLGMFVKASATFHWCCSPVVDIGPDLSVWPCFPLSGYNKQALFDFDSMDDVVKRFVGLVREETRGVAGMYDACDDCEHLERRCTGGCVANFITHPEPVGSERAVDVVPSVSGGAP
jgi:hypothetical protein